MNIHVLNNENKKLTKRKKPACVCKVKPLDDFGDCSFCRRRLKLKQKKKHQNHVK